jgi:hypothetical protein
MAMAAGTGIDVRWRNSQPPTRVVASGGVVWDSMGTDSRQFDRVRDVDKIRTRSVGYRNDLN